MIGYPLILGTNGYSLENHSGIMCSCRSIEKRVLFMAWGTTINITNGQLQIHLCTRSISKFMLAIITVRLGWSNHAVSAQPKHERKYIWQLAGCRSSEIRESLKAVKTQQAMQSHNQGQHLRYEWSQTGCKANAWK